jgi:hypothetical protein
MKYVIVRTHKRIDDVDSELYPRHPVMWMVREDYVYEDLADALIERSKLEFPEDYIVLPFYRYDK